MEQQNVSTVRVEVTEATASGPKGCVSRTTRFLGAIYKVVSSHVGLILILGVYTFIGGAVFHAIEGRVEQEMLDNVTSERSALVEKIYNATTVTPWDKRNVSEFILKELKMYETLMMDSYRGAIQKNGTMRKWDFWGSLFFCATVYTTVGYGHIAPRTPGGRIATIVYALVGIPLFLIVMADLGKLLTKIIKLIRAMLKLSYRKLCKPVLQKVCCCKGPPRKKTREIGPEAFEAVSNRSESGDEDTDHESGTGDAADPHTADPEAENLHIPPYIAVGVAFLYILMGVGIYTRWENWTALEAFYFIFVSMSTIGFGDIMPEHPKFFMLSALYLMVGLSLLAMVINVMMEFTIYTMRKATIKMAEAIQAGKALGQDVVANVDQQIATALSHEASPGPSKSKEKEKEKEVLNISATSEV